MGNEYSIHREYQIIKHHRIDYIHCVYTIFTYIIYIYILYICHMMYFTLTSSIVFPWSIQPLASTSKATRAPQPDAVCKHRAKE